MGTPKQIFENKSQIEELGLDLPLTAYLSDMLGGVDNDLTSNGFITAVADVLAGGKGL